MRNIFERLKIAIISCFERWRVVAHDTLLIPVAWFGAFWFRYNLEIIPIVFLESALKLLPIVIILQFLCFISMGTYRGLWRFTAPHDLWQLIKAVVIGTTLISLTIFFITRLAYVPRTVFVFYALILIITTCLSRILFRYSTEHNFVTHDNAKKALIVGAGHAAEQLVRDLLKAKPREYTPVAFVDDDRQKIGQKIRGINVAGNCDSIPELCQKWALDMIIIAVPSANDKEMQRIVSFCESSGVPFRTLPAIQDIVSGRADSAELREVRIEDLLGRDQISLQNDLIGEFIHNKTVMVTGGGGSIGSELCRQVCLAKPKQLIVFDQSEFNLYSIDKELLERFNAHNVVSVIGDVCDEVAVKHVFDKYSPDIVFHAAAYKHVPLLQSQIREAAKNNVLGTRLLSQYADKYNAEKFVLISTDKAVNPTNWMGVSKRSAEVVCQNMAAKSKTEFDVVRFGNVLGSAGSVVPRFREQIKKGGPITVTHKEMTRYFMTIKEATQLILEASTLESDEDSQASLSDNNIYVLDMGSPIQISFLAEQMIRLSGLIPEKDIPIVYTGLRPGEKLYEELFYEQEILMDTTSQKIFKAKHKKLLIDDVDLTLDKISEAVERFDEDEIAKCLCYLVPEVCIKCKEYKEMETV